MTLRSISRAVSGIDQAVALVEKANNHRKLLIITVTLLAVAAIGIFLGVQALQPHHVALKTSPALPFTGPAPTVTAHPNSADSFIAVMTLGIGALGSIAGFGSMVIAYLAWRRPRNRPD